MQLCWASRVFDGVPEAESWAVAYVTLSAARALVTGIPPAPTAEAERHLRHVLGERAARAASLPELADRVTGTTRRVLADVSGQNDLWRAEARFWRDVEAEAVGLAGASRPGPGVAVGAVGLLAADAWRARAALEILARGRSMAAEVFDAVA
jgi:hypothetical protein